jgi:protein subunit release factor A
MFATRIIRQIPTTLMSQIQARLPKATKIAKAQFQAFDTQQKGLEELLVMANEENDTAMQTEVMADFKTLQEKLDDFNLDLALYGAEDACILELRAGSGGEEACDWCEELTEGVDF